jgi:hypothetical protein
MSDAPDGIIMMPMAAIAVNEGECLKDASQNLALAATVNDSVLFIAAQTSIDDVGAALTLTAGDLWPVYPLGCNKVVNVRSLTGKTWRTNAIVYNSQTAGADGTVDTDSTNSATKIGRYVGPDNVATSGTTLIRVLLCFDPIA